MRIPSATLVAACVFAAAGAEAAPIAFDGTLELAFAGVGLPALAVTGAGVADAQPLAGSLALRALSLDGGVTGAQTVPVTDPEVPSTLAALRLSVRLGSGVLAPFDATTPAGVVLTQNQVGASGALRLCILLPSCGAGPDLPLSGGGAGLGVGGEIAIGAASFPVSLQYAPWTVGTAWLPFQTPQGASFSWPTFGSAHGPLSLTGSTLAPGGRVGLVSPVVVTSPLLSAQPIPAVARLSIRFVPEPGVASMLGAGALALVLIGRHRPGRKT